jgi:hypothetical protein
MSTHKLLKESWKPWTALVCRTIQAEKVRKKKKKDFIMLEINLFGCTIKKVFQSTVFFLLNHYELLTDSVKAKHFMDIMFNKLVNTIIMQVRDQTQSLPSNEKGVHVAGILVTVH